nr:hypothetical protein [Rodentibacter trehalosifermentans]
MVFVLSACASQAPQDPNVLPDGIMQPVEGTGAVAGGSFMPEIEQQTMPNTMK